MTVDPKTLLKFANLQMAAESVFSFRPGRDDAISQPGTTAAYTNIRPDDLVYGNNRSSRFTNDQATEFSQLWEVVEHKSNTATGFSGTLFRAKAGGGTELQALRTKYGITVGEVCLSFRSTEFADDAARDNQATNAMEVRPFGWAFGQIADMEAWYQSLKNDPSKLGANNYTVTGYSLDGQEANPEKPASSLIQVSSFTTNSIAFCADNTPAKCSKGFKNRSKPSLHRCKNRKYKPNRQLPGIEPAQSATELVVEVNVTNSTCEVQHA